MFRTQVFIHSCAVLYTTYQWYSRQQPYT